MNPLLGLAFQLLPDLSKLFTGEKAGGLPEVLAKSVSDQIGKTVTEVTGTSSPDAAATAVQQNAAMKADLQVKLAQIAIENQRLANEDKERERQAALADAKDQREKALEEQRLAKESVADARRFSVELADKGWLATTPHILSYIVVLGFLALIVMMARGWVNQESMDSNVLQIFNILIGALAAAFAGVMNYFLGSSSGSKDKDAVIQAQNAQNRETVKEVVKEAAKEAARKDGDGQPSEPGPGDGGSPPGKPSGPASGGDPVTPAKPGLFAEVMPELMKSHRHFPNSAQWALTPRGIAVDGAAAQGTPGEPSTVRGIWEKFGTFCTASSKKYGVPVELIVATIATESRGDPNVRRFEAHKNDESVGLMQTMVATAREDLGQPSLTGDDLRDPARSIDAGTAHIAKQRATTHFDPPMVAAAYNAGSIRLADHGGNRWRLACHKPTDGAHIDRYIAWFADAMRVSRSDNWGADGAPSFAAEISQKMPADRTDPDFPPPPPFSPLISTAERQQLFGAFNFQPAPTSDNPEAIKILGNWANENIVDVKIHLKSPLLGKNPFVIPFHKKAAKQLEELFLEWEAAGLLDRILTWGGSYVPRFVRGSKTNLSNHAFGTAFDINAAQNGLNVEPALVGEKGSVRELVEIANKHGFFWGGHYKKRLDGMHFEVGQLKS
jgi:hypothetical protein